FYIIRDIPLSLGNFCIVGSFFDTYARINLERSCFTDYWINGVQSTLVDRVDLRVERAYSSTESRQPIGADWYRGAGSKPV
ncbi:hypothetical protein V1478_005927, partial [Vespula squamosa]